MAHNYEAGDRRPIPIRDWRISQRLAGWLARRGVSANAISLAGMISGIMAGTALALTAYAPDWQRALWLGGAGLIQLRLLANMLDGMVAIESGKASPMGELYNEAPDRISDAATLIGAGYALGGDIVLGYVAACVALFVAYVRALGKAAGAPQQFCGPMAKQQRMALITIIALYCGLMPDAWRPAWGNSPAWGLISVGLVVIIFGGFVTAWRRLVRIAAHLRKPSP